MIQITKKEFSKKSEIFVANLINNNDFINKLFHHFIDGFHLFKLVLWNNASIYFIYNRIIGTNSFRIIVLRNDEDKNFIRFDGHELIGFTEIISKKEDIWYEKSDNCPNIVMKYIDIKIKNPKAILIIKINKKYEITEFSSYYCLDKPFIRKVEGLYMLKIILDDIMHKYEIHKCQTHHYVNPYATDIEKKDAFQEALRKFVSKT